MKKLYKEILLNLMLIENEVDPIVRMVAYAKIGGIIEYAFVKDDIKEEKAKQVLLNLVEKYPNSYQAHKWLANIYEKQEKWDIAMDEYTRAIDLRSSDKDSYLYGRSIPLYIENEVNRISNYIIQERENYDYIYFFSANAYYVKMNVEYPLTKYDMISNGNMGYRGADKYIKELDDYCNNHSCMFILYKYEFRENNISQTNRKLVNYVKNKYLKVDDVGGFDIYNNLNS